MRTLLERPPREAYHAEHVNLSFTPAARRVCIGTRDGGHGHRGARAHAERRETHQARARGDRRPVTAQVNAAQVELRTHLRRQLGGEFNAASASRQVSASHRPRQTKQGLTVDTGVFDVPGRNILAACSQQFICLQVVQTPIIFKSHHAS